MLKNKLKIITLLIVIILTLALPISRANDGNQIMPRNIETQNENEEDINTNINDGVIDEIQDDIMLINNDDETAITTTDETSAEDENATEDETENESESQETKTTNGDVYLSGDNVEINEIIDGNLFVIANNVTINSQIGGDAFICAKNITISENGYIFSNLFTLSDNLNIDGVVYDLYSISKNATISGYIYRDMRISSNNLDIFGTIRRNAFVNCSNMNFSNIANSNSKEESEINVQGMISGNLNYSSTQEADIPEGCVSGDVNYTEAASLENNSITNYIMSLGTLIATVIIVWLLCLWLAPKFTNNVSALITSKKILPVLGLGILTPIVSILLSILLLVLGITSTLGILLFAILFILIAISTSIFIIAINNIVCDKLKIQKTIGKLGILIISTAVIWLVGLIPFVGSLVGIIAIIIGLGTIVYSLPLKITHSNEL